MRDAISRIVILCGLTGALAGQNPPVQVQVQNGNVFGAIANGIQPPRVDDMTTAAMRAMQVRQIQLQNERLQMENEQRRQAMQKGKPAPSLQQQPAPPIDVRSLQTYGLFNGRAWNIAAPNERAIYVHAAIEALAFVSPDSMKGRIDSPLSYDEWVAALDRFYADPTNVLIPVMGGMEIVNMQAGGRPEAEISKQISVARQVGANAPERTPAAK